MTPRNLRVFLDTSVIFSAVFSADGGARRLFQLGEAGILTLIAGPTVLKEADEVVRRKIPSSLPLLALLLDVGQVHISPLANSQQIQFARRLVFYEPDMRVLAEALAAEADWLVTHDQIHFLKILKNAGLRIEIGTPGDLIQHIKDQLPL